MLDVSPESIVITVINLLILLVALRLVLFKPVQKIIAARQEEADKQFDEASKKQEAADEMKVQYENSLAEVHAEKKNILNAAREDADEQYQKIVNEARSEAKHIKKKAAVEAEAQKEQIMKSAEKEIADMIVNAAAKVVGEQSGLESNAALYDEFLNKAGE
ncbi:MAG: ATP synthase F0 subunit B [Eubacterium sp.]|nr:ATP synthase F0 subunit B [Eubacterium sp.]